MNRLAASALRIALPCLLLTACLEPEEVAPPEKVWHGLLLNTCGPTDGPAVTIALDTAEYASCGAVNPGEYRIVFNGIRIENLGIGASLTDSSFSCEKCFGYSRIRLQVERMDANRVQASFRIDDKTLNAANASRKGTVVLTKCREQPMCG